MVETTYDEFYVEFKNDKDESGKIIRKPRHYRFPKLDTTEALSIAELAVQTFADNETDYNPAIKMKNSIYLKNFIFDRVQIDLSDNNFVPIKTGELYMPATLANDSMELMAIHDNVLYGIILPLFTKSSK